MYVCPYECLCMCVSECVSVCFRGNQIQIKFGGLGGGSLRCGCSPFAVGEVKTPPGPQRLGWQNPPGDTQTHEKS